MWPFRTTTIIDPDTQAAESLLGNRSPKVRLPPEKDLLDSVIESMEHINNTADKILGNIKVESDESEKRIEAHKSEFPVGSHRGYLGRKVTVVDSGVVASTCTTCGNYTTFPPLELYVSVSYWNAIGDLKTEVIRGSAVELLKKRRPEGRSSQL